MAILIVAVVLVGLLCLLDLLLTFGVIRRLREHTEQLSRLVGELPVLGLATGESPGEFSAVTTTGELVTDTAKVQMVSFFSSSCSACPERVPSFISYLINNRIGRDSVLAVVEGGHDEPVPYLDQLAEVALVCVEPSDGEIAKAFEVNGYPLFFLLDADGAVAISGYDPALLPAPAPATA
jgi:thiol-disulfide isomerase/thioredoxin